MEEIKIRKVVNGFLVTIDYSEKFKGVNSPKRLEVVALNLNAALEEVHHAMSKVLKWG